MRLDEITLKDNIEGEGGRDIEGKRKLLEGLRIRGSFCLFVLMRGRVRVR